MELGKTPTVPFNIFTNARYRHVKVIWDEVVLWMSIVSLNKSIKKFDILSIEEK